MDSVAERSLPIDVNSKKTISETASKFRSTDVSSHFVLKELSPNSRYPLAEC